MDQMETSEVVFCDASLIFVAKDQLEMHMAAIIINWDCWFYWVNMIKVELGPLLPPAPHN
jgi:hypothetical protein